MVLDSKVSLNESFDLFLSKQHLFLSVSKTQTEKLNFQLKMLESDAYEK